MQDIYDINPHYVVGDKRFFNKIAAVRASVEDKQPIHYNMYDKAYNQHKWSEEPNESLDELYAARVQELRNKYDYLVLHFSGGDDSTNILETFIKNNIKLDEIFIRGALSTVDKDPSNTLASNMYAESLLCALPLAEYVKNNHIPDVKITLRDTTQFTIDYFKNNKEWFSTDNFIPTFTPNNSFSSQVDILEPAWVKMIESGKKVGHIIGIEKPMMCYVKDQYAIRFMDKRIWTAPIGFLSPSLKIPTHQESFYWAVNTAKMIIKQGHAIKNFIKKNKMNPNVIFGMDARPQQNFFSNIIYKRTLPKYFEVDKTPDGAGVIKPWDLFFFKDGLESEHGRSWGNGMHELMALVPDIWKESPSQYNFHELKGMYTRFYPLGR